MVLETDCSRTDLVPKSATHTYCTASKTAHVEAPAAWRLHLKLVSAFQPPGELLEPIPRMVRLSLGSVKHDQFLASHACNKIAHGHTVEIKVEANVRRLGARLLLSRVLSM